MSEADISQLYDAIVKEDNERASTLLARPGIGNHINRQIGLGTCLHLTCMKNNPEVCKALLDNGANTGVTEIYGSTPLHTASDKGHLECVKLLVQYGANVSTKCKGGFTARDLAKHTGQKEVAEYLSQFMTGSREDLIARPSVTECPFYARNPDGVDACPPSCKPGNLFGMGYKFLDERLATMETSNDQKFENLHGKVTDVSQGHNQLKEDFSEVRENQRDNRERIKKLEENLYKLEVDSPRPRGTISKSDSVNRHAVAMVDAVQQHFTLLADSIIATDIMYSLFEKKALNSNDLDVIDNIAATRQKTIKLLRILLDKRDPSWVFTFRDILAASELELMQKLVDVIWKDVPPL